MKKLFLGNTDLGMGILMGSIASLLGLLLVVGFAALIGYTLPGAFIGAFTAPFIGVWVYNYGLIDIPLKHRAVPTWFGARDPHGEYEMAEGLHWIFKWFGMMGYDQFNMQDRPTLLHGIPIEVRNGNKVPTDITVNWKPRAGQLFHFGNMKDIVNTFMPEAQQVVRTFGISYVDLDDLVSSNPAEHLSQLVRDYLNQVSLGKAVRVSVTHAGKGENLNVAYTDVGIATPWGIEITGAPVSDFSLPDSISEAADEIDEAERRTTASRALVGGLADGMDPLIQKGVNPTAAMSATQSVMMPDRPQTVKTVNLIGLDGIAHTIVSGLLSAFGKPPIPPTPTPEPTTSPEPKE